MSATPAPIDPAVRALHRAMPYTRLVDCGMNPADARGLLAASAAGDDWAGTADSLAEDRASAAESASAAGHRATALLQGRWAVGAALFAQMAENEDTPGKRSRYRRYVERFGWFAGHRRLPVERVEVPYRGGRLVGWLCLPDAGSAAATVILWGGLSGWGAAYLNAADALTARGVACLLAEGPGQGEPRLTDKLYLDADVATGFARFIDAVQADPRLGEAIGLQGNSFGGLFAAHIAARDTRVRACVVNGAPATPRLPPFRSARAQFAAAFGSDDEQRLTATLDTLRFDADRHPISAPVLVLHGGADKLVTDAQIQAPFARAAGTQGELRSWSDGEHTLYNHAAERDAIVADWFADRLLAGVPCESAQAHPSHPRKEVR